jgi:hypothetical protein
MSPLIRHGNEAPPWSPLTLRTGDHLSSRVGIGFRF